MVAHAGRTTKRQRPAHRGPWARPRRGAGRVNGHAAVHRRRPPCARARARQGAVRHAAKKRARAGRVRPNVARFQPMLDGVRPNSARNRPNLARVRPKFGRLLPKLGRVRRTLVGFRPGLGHKRGSGTRFVPERLVRNVARSVAKRWVRVAGQLYKGAPSRGLRGWCRGNDPEVRRGRPHEDRSPKELAFGREAVQPAHSAVAAPDSAAPSGSQPTGRTGGQC